MSPASHSAESTNTYVVELTPQGRAAVAVVLVTGPVALRAVDECFAPVSGRPVAEIPWGRIILGRWGGAAGEELIVCRRDDEQIEIHCHGGSAAVDAVISALVVEGCQQIQWQDWIRHRSPDPIRAAAQIALADATTERTAAILLDQLNGALHRAIGDIAKEISAENWGGAAESIDALLSRRDLGLHLTRPWRIVVCGPPNVGKSSLINALAGYERSIVSPLPGTTRDVVTVATAIDGWPVQLADTAGIRTTQDELELGGIQLATSTLAEADLAIVVHDATKLATELFSEEVSDLHSNLVLPAKTIHAINKIDLIAFSERRKLADRSAESQSEGRETMLVSALTGEGIAELVSAISHSLVPASVPTESAVPFTMKQFDCLAAIRDAVQHRDSQAAARMLRALLSHAQ